MRASERSLKEGITSDEEAGDLYGELPSGLSRLIANQPLTATFQYLLSLISTMYRNSPSFSQKKEKQKGKMQESYKKQGNQLKQEEEDFYYRT